MPLAAHGKDRPCALAHWWRQPTPATCLPHLIPRRRAARTLCRPTPSSQTIYNPLAPAAAGSLSCDICGPAPPDPEAAGSSYSSSSDPAPKSSSLWLSCSRAASRAWMTCSSRRDTQPCDAGRQGGGAAVAKQSWQRRTACAKHGQRLKAAASAASGGTVYKLALHGKHCSAGSIVRCGGKRTRRRSASSTTAIRSDTLRLRSLRLSLMAAGCFSWRSWGLQRAAEPLARRAFRRCASPIDAAPCASARERFGDLQEPAYSPPLASLAPPRRLREESWPFRQRKA